MYMYYQYMYYLDSVCSITVMYACIEAVAAIALRPERTAGPGYEVQYYSTCNNIYQYDFLGLHLYILTYPQRFYDTTFARLHETPATRHIFQAGLSLLVYSRL